MTLGLTKGRIGLTGGYMLKGEAKKEYQREYMRKRRAKEKGLTADGSNGSGLTTIPETPKKYKYVFFGGGTYRVEDKGETNERT